VHRAGVRSSPSIAEPQPLNPFPATEVFRRTNSGTAPARRVKINFHQSVCLPARRREWPKRAAGKFSRFLADGPAKFSRGSVCSASVRRAGGFQHVCWSSRFSVPFGGQAEAELQPQAIYVSPRRRFPGVRAAIGNFYGPARRVAAARQIPVHACVWKEARRTARS